MMTPAFRRRLNSSPPAIGERAKTKLVAPSCTAKPISRKPLTSDSRPALTVARLRLTKA